MKINEDVKRRKLQIRSKKLSIYDIRTKNSNPIKNINKHTV